MSKVLVTGGSGFIASHCISQLLAGGHTVRTTVRDLKREPAARAQIAAVAGTAPASPDRLAFVAANLDQDTGWDAAVAGCEYVLHVASPFPLGVPKHEDELIVPAREGTLRVLRAAKAAGVRRAVVTSSFAAVGYGHAEQTAPFDETSWTNLAGSGLTAYVKSKTIAEKAAWDYVAGAGRGLELATVNPVAVFGPVASDDFATSIAIVKKMLDGSIPACPKLSFGVVDVRDVADLHLRAMLRPEARGERFLAVAGDFLTMHKIALSLRERLGERARKVPKRELPNWAVRLASLVDSSVKQAIPELGKRKNATSDKARRVLGWQPRSAEDAVAATGESLIKLGLV